MPVPLRRTSCVLICYLLVACTTSTAELARPLSPDDVETPLRPQLPRVESFFPEPSFDAPKLSPDGNLIAAIRRSNGQSSIITLDLESGSIVPVTSILGSNVNDLWWGNETRLILGLTDPTGLVHRLAAVDIDGSRFEDFGSERNFPGVTQRRPESQLADIIVSPLPDDPNNILVAYPFQIALKRIASNVFRLNIYTGRLTPEASTRLLALEWFPDGEGKIDVGFGFLGGASYLTVRSSTLRTWTKVPTSDVPSLLDASLIPLGTTSQQGVLYVRSRDASDRWELYRYDIASGTFSDRLLGDPEFDVEGPLLYSSPRAGEPMRVIGVRYTADYPRIAWLEPSWQEMAGTIDATLPNTVNDIVSWSRDETRLLVLASSDIDPGTYYVYDRSKRRLTRLFDRYPELSERPLTPLRSVRYAARDGARVPGYLALPGGIDAKLAGAASGEATQIPAGGVPLIVYPHGGSTGERPAALAEILDPLSARDSRAFDSEVQFFTSRGYGVFKPNYRGSSGFGQAYSKLGVGQWDGRIPEDVIDGVRWLIDSGVADPDRICLYANDAGAYVSLAALAKQPSLFACAVLRDGIFDFDSYLNERRVRAAIEQQTLESRQSLFADGGRILEAQLDLDRTQPDVSAQQPLIDRARTLTTPILIAYGEENRVVSPAQSKRLAAALAETPGQIEVVPLVGQPNFFRDAALRVTFYRTLERFLLRHLGTGYPDTTSDLEPEHSRHVDPPLLSPAAATFAN